MGGKIMEQIMQGIIEFLRSVLLTGNFAGENRLLILFLFAICLGSYSGSMKRKGAGITFLVIFGLFVWLMFLSGREIGSFNFFVVLLSPVIILTVTWIEVRISEMNREASKVVDLLNKKGTLKKEDGGIVVMNDLIESEIYLLCRFLFYRHYEAGGSGWEWKEHRLEDFLVIGPQKITDKSFSIEFPLITIDTSKKLMLRCSNKRSEIVVCGGAFVVFLHKPD
jgi:hypothetical protein